MNAGRGVTQLAQGHDESLHSVPGWDIPTPAGVGAPFERLAKFRTEASCGHANAALRRGQRRHEATVFARLLAKIVQAQSEQSILGSKL